MGNVINKGWRYSTPADAIGNPEDDPVVDPLLPASLISLLKGLILIGPPVAGVTGQYAEQASARKTLAGTAIDILNILPLQPGDWDVQTFSYVYAVGKNITVDKLEVELTNVPGGVPGTVGRSQWVSGIAVKNTEFYTTPPLSARFMLFAPTSIYTMLSYSLTTDFDVINFMRARRWA
jgi:hypothetical protein